MARAQPDTVLVDLCLDVAVGRAAHAETDRAAGTVTGQADHTHVVGEVLTTELCAEANLMSFFEQLGLEVEVAEGAAGLVARRWQVVEIVDRAELHGQQVLLCRCAANDEADVVRRTSGCAEALHLLHEERQQCALVLNRSLGHRVEIGLVGRATAFGNHHKAVLSTLGSLDVDLCGQVALGVHLFVHGQGRILRVAQIVLSIRVVHTA